MKIGIACGGTGGHIFPGLATAEFLRSEGHEVILWISGREVEQKALDGCWYGTLITIKTTGFQSRPGWSWLKPLKQLFLAYLQCRRDMRRLRPDALLAMGGYAAVAPVIAALEISIPVIIHESNVIPGRANRLLKHWARTFALGFNETRNHISHPNLVYTGIPIREMKFENIAINWSMLTPGVFTLFIIGGSRGAHALNEVVTRTIINLHAAGKPIQVIHLTGTEDENSVRQAYFDAGVPNVVVAFMHDMANAYHRATLAICRAGGSTCTELAYYGVPALLVPYPFAASHHQLANADALKKAGAADVIEESKLTVDRLSAYILDLMANGQKLQDMKKAALKRADRNAAKALADLVLETAGKQQ
jgi:UDP-N-acetylglucosamine--N-acetylmuramyl-(pentapeptide) pyrophosphoryl-undecaprenol N-acetylglucosamine transferase